MHRLVVKLGLADQINQDLALLKVHLPYHESDHVLTLAYNVLCGGTHLLETVDAAVLRAELTLRREHYNGVH